MSNKSRTMDRSSGVMLQRQKKNASTGFVSPLVDSPSFTFSAGGGGWGGAFGTQCALLANSLAGAYADCT